MSNTTRIAKNTLLLYFRQILIMLVSLYTVRVVLNALGAEDYGLYNVVAGVVTMFGFISAAMSTASQRFFSFDLGKNDNEHLKITFSLTVTIYFIMAILVVVVAETLGLWFVLKKLTVPADRVVAARWIYQFSIISFFFTIMTAPFMADIIAHEDMNIYAYVSIVEVALKLLVAYLIKIYSADKLIFYGLLMAVVTIVNTTIYRTICKRKYKECKYKFYWDKTYAKEMFSFTGWNMFGSAVGIFKNQLVNILLNQYFNPVVNAAKSVSMQVRTAVSSFSQNFSTALRPQIIKSYAAENYDEALELTFMGCKFTYFLMWVFTLPLILEMEPLLSLWLGNPPEYAVIFTKLALLDVLIDSLNFPLMSLAQATGKIKLYQGVVGGILLMNFPVCWIVLSMGADAWTVQLIGIIITMIAMIVRLIIIKMLTKFSIIKFLHQVILPVCCVSFISFTLSFGLYKVLSNTIIMTFIKIIVDLIFVALIVFAVGVTKNERKSLLSFIRSKIHR